jgi:hypothetical protein
MDRYIPEYPQPPHTSYAILSQSPVIDLDDGQPDVANSVLYQAPGGAWVFGAGTISWAWALDDFQRNLADARIQQTTVNILSLFGVDRP